MKYIDTSDTRKLETIEGDEGKQQPTYLSKKELLSFLLLTSFLTYGQVIERHVAVVAICINFDVGIPSQRVNTNTKDSHERFARIWAYLSKEGIAFFYFRSLYAKFTKLSSHRFYPTRLAISLCSGKSTTILQPSME